MAEVAMNWRVRTALDEHRLSRSWGQVVHGYGRAASGSFPGAGTNQAEPLPATIPGRVILAGIGYRVQEAEGLIVFAEDVGIFGCRRRIAFERRAMLWYVSISGTTDNAPMSHVTRAYDYVKAAYGGSFEGKNGEHRP